MNPCAVPVADIEPGVPCADGVGVIPGGNWDESQSSIKDVRNDIDSWGANITATWDMGWAELTSVSAYESNEMRRNHDTIDTPSVLFGFHQETELDQWSQEIRLTSQGDDNYRWILGGFYFFEEQLLTTVVRRTPPVRCLPQRGSVSFRGASPSCRASCSSRMTKNGRYTGRGEYDFNDKLTFTAGIRGSWETKEGWNLTQIGNGGQFGPDEFIGKDEVLLNPLAIITKAPLYQKSKEWGGRAGVDYRFNDDFHGVFQCVTRFQERWLQRCGPAGHPRPGGP